jgi:hypothetical protein
VKKTHLRVLLLALVLGTSVGACECTRSVEPANHNVAAQSLTVFPQTIGPGDSAIVTCYATDSDGDTLLYDWFSD